MRPLGAVSAAVAMSSWESGRDRQREAVEATRKGMEAFRKGDVKGSIALFNEALELDPRQKPYLWQRGLSLYYADRLSEAAEQFRADVAVNPNDTEESIWCFLSEARESSPQEARSKFLEVSWSASLLPPPVPVASQPPVAARAVPKKCGPRPWRWLSLLPFPGRGGKGASFRCLLSLPCSSPLPVPSSHPLPTANGWAAMGTLL